MAIKGQQSVKSRITAKNKKAKYKLKSTKYIYTGATVNKNNKRTKKYSYVSRRITGSGRSRKYSYRYS